jgi:hypothetical protein
VEGLFIGHIQCVMVAGMPQATREPPEEQNQERDGDGWSTHAPQR